MNQQTKPTTGATGKDRRMAIAMVVAAFLLRLAVILVFHTYEFPAGHNHYAFGYEMGSISGSLARGEGFSSPFGVPTGPTAWIAPVYPAMIAAIFKVFGLYSNASAIMILGINSLFSGLACAAIFVLGRELLGRQVGLVAGWWFALVPLYWRYPTTWVWEFPLSGLLLVLIFLVSVRLDTARWQPWAGFGVLWSVMALVSPSQLSVLPFTLAYPAWKIARGRKIPWKQMAITVAVFCIAITPWLARNRAAFGRWVFLRSNFGFEFWLDNYPGANGAAWSGRHPASNPRILAEYEKLGEIDFAKEKQREAFQFIRDYPGEFTRLTMMRMTDFWDGRTLIYESPDEPLKPWMILTTSLLAWGGLLLMLRNRERGAWLFLTFMLILPAPFYLTYTEPKYRHPLEPLMSVMTAYLLCAAWNWGRRRQKA